MTQGSDHATVEWLLAGDPAIRWNTLRALRVLRWWDAAGATPS